MQPLPPEPTLKNILTLYLMPWRHSRVLHKVTGSLSLLTVITSLAGLIWPGKIGDILVWIGVSALVPCTVLLTIQWFRDERKLRAQTREWRKKYDEEFRQSLKNMENEH